MYRTPDRSTTNDSLGSAAEPSSSRSSLTGGLDKPTKGGSGKPTSKWKKLARSVSKLSSSSGRSGSRPGSATSAKPTGNTWGKAPSYHATGGSLPAQGGATARRYGSDGAGTVGTGGGGGQLAAGQRTGGAAGSRAAGTAGGADMATSLAAKMRMFEEGSYNLDANLDALTEKGLDNLRGELGQLDAEVLEALRKAVHAQYPLFIKATPGILALEGEVGSLRNLLSSLSTVIASLDAISAASQPTRRGALGGAGGAGAGGAGGLQGAGASGAAGAAAAEAGEAAWRESGDGTKWGEYLDDCDMAIAERRLPEALSLVRKLEQLEQLAQRASAGTAGPAAQGASRDTASPRWRQQQQGAWAEGLAAQAERRRQALVPLAEQALSQPTASPGDLRRGVTLLAEVAGRQHSQRVLLDAHSAKLRRQQDSLLKPASSGGADADGCDYAAALGQKLVLALGAAADDVAAVFGGAGAGGADGAQPGSPGSREDTTGFKKGGADVAAALLVWALQEVERACQLLRKHALAPFAAPAGLAATCRCLHTLLAYCAALEASHALRLMPAVLRETWPVVEQVLLKRARKAGEALRRSAYTEVDQVAEGRVALPQDLAAWEGLAAVFPSADFLLDELEAIAADLASVHSPRAAAAVRRAVAELFQGYTQSLAAALNRRLKSSSATEEELDRLAQGAEVAMEAATVLVERLLPDAAAPLSELYGDVCGIRQLGQHLMQMGESLGMTTVSDTPRGSSGRLPVQESSLSMMSEASQEPVLAQPPVLERQRQQGGLEEGVSSAATGNVVARGMAGGIGSGSAGLAGGARGQAGATASTEAEEDTDYRIRTTSEE